MTAELVDAIAQALAGDKPVSPETSTQAWQVLQAIQDNPAFVALSRVHHRQVLAAVVLAAGGRVKVPRDFLERLGKLTLTTSDDRASGLSLTARN